MIECDAADGEPPCDPGFDAQQCRRSGLAESSLAAGHSPSSGWDPGKKLTLTARDDYWGGRAFLDSIEIEMGKSFREQMILLDLGKADVVEIAPEQARHAAADGRRVENSAPAELMALVFTRERALGGRRKIAPGVWSSASTGSR